jgi:hypothetical protein
MADIPHSNEQPNRRALRLALGATLAFGLAQLSAWPLAQLTPAIVVIVLQDASPIPFRQGCRIIAMAGFMFLLGGVVTWALTPWPALLVVTTVYLVYRTYKIMLDSSSHTLVLITPLIGFTVVPVLVVLLPSLGLVAIYGFFLDFLFGMIISWCAWLIMPRNAPLPQNHHAEPMTDEVVEEIAQTLTIVITPLMLVFLFFGWSKVLVLAYGVLFSTMYSGAGIRKMGYTYIIANGVYAGLGMLICYELFVMVPSLPFMLVVMFLAFLIFSQRIFQGGATGAFWASGIFGFLIMLGGVLMKDEVVTPGTVFDRIMQMVIATAYVTFAFTVVEMIRGWLKKLANRRSRANGRNATGRARIVNFFIRFKHYLSTGFSSGK